MMNFRSSVLTCVCFFLVGFLTAPTTDNSNSNNNTSHKQQERNPNDNNNKNGGSAVGTTGGGGLQNSLQQHHPQAKAQETFQQQIHDLQFPPDDCGQQQQRRILVVKPSSRSTTSSSNSNNLLEQFAREFHALSLALQVAVATKRTLVLHDEWSLLPDNDNIMEVNCLAGDNGITLDHPHTNNHHGDDDDDDASFLSSMIFMNFRRIPCLKREAISNCVDNQHGRVVGGNRGDSPAHPPHPQQQQQQLHVTGNYSSVAFGIIPNVIIDKHNSLFHATYYGSQPSVEMPEWPYPRTTYLIDIVPSWERAHGRFWIRSQMVHFLWENWQQPETTTTTASSSRKSSSSTTTTSPAGVPSSLSLHHNHHRRPYIAFYWISSKKMRRNLAIKFGRNATVTQDFHRYMTIARRIRQVDEEEHRHHHHKNKEPLSLLPPLNTIVIITDDNSARSGSPTTNNEGVPIPDQTVLRNKWPDWKFVVVRRLWERKKVKNEEEEKGSDKAKAAILASEKRMLASLQIMRQANYLVGSFQSQMFRLAAELNAAWFAARSSRYPMTMRRHWTVDVEWFENP